MKKWISYIAAFLWFFGVLFWMLLGLPFMMIIFPTDIITIMESGVSGPAIGFIFLLAFSFIFSITMFVPAFRNCFRILPWLYPYITILIIDFTILSIGIEILNYGYRIQSDASHSLYFKLMIVQMVVCRIAMCIFCHKKPMRIAREDYEQ